jgi:hypothetical protein
LRLPRKNPELNDAIELLDQHYVAADKNVSAAWARLSADEAVWIDTEIDKCLDKRYYLENYHTIKTERNILKTLYPFWDHQEMVYEAMQEEWEAKDECNLIILKPRQTGVSVWTAAAMFHQTIFHPHMFTMVIAQDIKTNTHLYNMCLNAYYLLPWWLRPEYIYKTKTGAIEFQRVDEKLRGLDPGLGSMIQVSPANQVSGVAIGRSISNLHMSEVSRYPENGLYEADIKPSTRSAQHGFRVMESTGLGRNGLFYEQWCAAVDGETEFRPVFIPVYKVRKYYKVADSTFELADDEKNFNERIKKENHFAIPDAFWNFYRTAFRAARRAGSNAKSGFIESYPLTPAQAFQSSGLCAFDKDSLEWQQLNKACRPTYAGEITLISIDKGANTSDIVPVDEDEILPRRKSGRGGKRFHVWEMPERGATYYVASDIALGNGGNYTSVTVWRAGEGMEPDTVVATWLGWIPPKRAAHVISAIGLFYNSAEVACEYAKDGITTGNELRDLDYPNLYRPQYKDRLTHQASNYLHWYTNSKTRDEIIGCMNEALLDHTVVIRDEDALDEMIDFAAVDGDRIEGQGNEDDQVFSHMIGLYCLRETTKHLKSAAVAEDKNRDDGQVFIYGVYDNFMRQRGQYNTNAEAIKAQGVNPGWTVRPIPVTNANTLFSPIFDQMGAEFELHKHGVHSTEILPDMVYAYRSAMQNFGSGQQEIDDSW